MEGQETPPPILGLSPTSTNLDPFLFTSHGSFPTNSLQLQPSPSSSFLLQQPFDVDLVGLLSSAPQPPPPAAAACSSVSDNVNGHMPLMAETALAAPPLTVSENPIVEEIQERAIKDKRSRAGKNRKVSVPRVMFQTRSPDDILDDGYRWRKYGQKAVKNSKYPRSYYRCSHHTCNVKKQVQRLSKDNGVVVTTYEGVHNHPCEKLMETLTPILKQIQFLTRI